MDYHRSPFREKQSNYDITLTPKRGGYRNQEPFHIDKQNPHRSQINLNRKTQSSFRNTFLEGNSKHITSQIINQYDNEFSEKHERSYKRQSAFDAEIDPHNKSTFEENKKFNAKHFEIESKLNKIQSFHQKIETLLDMVNKKPKNPSKTSDLPNSFTPQKTPVHQQTSRSVNKISPLNLKQKLEIQRTGRDAVSRQLNERRQNRQQKYGDQNQQNNYHKNSMDQFDQISSNQPEEFWNNGRATSKFNDGKVVNRGEKQFKRQSKYFAKENKGPLIRASEQFKESNRKKSKEYMKSIEGEVRDIQNTIELLNQKIKQVDTISSFKKQIAFDNLSTSNPESLSDNQERVASEMQRIYKASRTPTRQYKQTEARNSPPNNYMKFREGESRNENSSYKNERSFRKTSMNVAGTPSRKDYQLETQGHRKEDSEFKRQGLKMINPYDGDVEQSEERNRYTLREMRAKRN